LKSIDIQSGVSDLQEAIKNDAGYPLAYIVLGAGLNKQRSFQEAERILRRGVSLDPNSWQGWFELAKAELSLENPQDALKDITRAQELNKDYPTIHLLMAHALLANRQYSQAAQEFEFFLSQAPNDTLATNARDGLSQARAFMQSSER
jgi:tetratricopeptide (TPR) repeat protein